MTDAEFARICAYFPSVKWRKLGDDYTEARSGFYCLSFRWLPSAAVWQCGLHRGDDFLHAQNHAKLGHALRSLECAVRREAATLAGLVGMGVAL